MVSAPGRLRFGPGQGANSFLAVGVSKVRNVAIARSVPYGKKKACQPAMIQIRTLHLLF